MEIIRVQQSDHVMSPIVVKSLIQIPFDGKLIDVCVERKTGTKLDSESSSNGIVLTHGAGGDMNLPQLSALADLLAMDGWVVVRFTCKGLNLAYRIKVYKAVLKYVVSQIVDVKSWIIGGRSMGARAAVGVANDIVSSPLDAKVAGVVCISYPLHPKGDTENLRDGPMKGCIGALCFISGTRDEMCEKRLLENVLQNVKTFHVSWIDDADHGLALPKKAEGYQQKRIEEIMKDTIVNWA